MKKILMLHCVNHNMFGYRDPVQYGSVTLEKINMNLNEIANNLAVKVENFQTNEEGKLIDRIHQAHQEKVDAIIINPSSWTHYSYGLRDALDILDIPIIEIHMSNIHNRETFRQQLMFGDIVTGVITGFGLYTYELGLRAAITELKTNEKEMIK